MEAVATCCRIAAWPTRRAAPRTTVACHHERFTHGDISAIATLRTVASHRSTRPRVGRAAHQRGSDALDGFDRGGCSDGGRSDQPTGPGPLQSAPQQTTVRAGRTVPLVFGLGGDYGLAVLEGGAPAVQQVDCATGAVVGDVQAATAPGGSDLTCDPATGRYIWPWQTKAAWAGTCRTLVLALDDGSEHEAKLRFR